jgi:hypothetical protein
VKLSNSPAKAGPMSGVQPMSRANALGLTFVPRLELDGPALRHFDSQLDSLRINQRFPGVYQEFSSLVEIVGIRVLSVGPGDREFKREELHVKQTTGIVCA